MTGCVTDPQSLALARTGGAWLAMERAFDPVLMPEMWQDHSSNAPRLEAAMRIGSWFWLLFAGLAWCPASTADPGTGIVALPDGSVVVADPGANRVWRLDANGRAEALLESIHSHLLQSTDSRLFGEHLVYRSDQQWESRFWELKWPERAFRWRTALRIEALPFSDALTLRQAPLGHTYSWLWTRSGAGTQILRRRSPTGQIEILGEQAWLPSPTAEPSDALRAKARAFGQIVSMAFSDDGRLLVVQIDRADWLDANLAMVPAITRAQVPKRQDAVPVPEFLTRFFGAWISADGPAYIADAGSRQVLRVSTDAGIDAIATLADSYFPVGLTARGKWLFVLEYPDPGLDLPLRVRQVELSGDGQGKVLGVLQLPASS